MTNYEYQKLLKDNYIIDSYQFYSTCNFKLFSVKTSFQALELIIENQLKNHKDEMSKIFDTLHKTGKASICANADKIDFCGIELDRNLAINKFTIEIFSIVHSFFDTYAQWINSTLYADDALKINDVSLHKVVNRISDFQEYSGGFVEMIKKVPQNEEYRFISDINNIVKHRHQIYI